MSILDKNSHNRLKILIIGDYNYTYNTHRVINFSIDHANEFLNTDVDYYWIRLSEFTTHYQQNYNDYDGFWIAPKPFYNVELLNECVQILFGFEKPVLITGEGFSNLIQILSVNYNVLEVNQKIISTNLVDDKDFEKQQIVPVSTQMIELYKNDSLLELTTCRFSLFPSVKNKLQDLILDVDAVDEYEEPCIVSLKDKNFFVATTFCPHISSQQGHPHPLIYTFLKALSI